MKEAFHIYHENIKSYNHWDVQPIYAHDDEVVGSSYLTDIYMDTITLSEKLVDCWNAQ